jgi:phosphate transport system substrate-binding protein
VLTRTAVSSIAGIAIAALALAGCSSDNNNPGPSGSTDPYASLSGSIAGSGSSFQNNFEQAAIDAFLAKATNADVTYASKGSGTGKTEFGSNLTDFAGTDSLVKDSDGIAAGSFYYIPLASAPITVSYNLSGVTGLKLSGTTLGSIFGRAIKNWNDPAIAQDNPGVTLPDKPIVVAHRSDGSGTTNRFTEYLTAAGGSGWTLGRGDSVAWPADTQAGAQNTGVAQIIKQSDGAIGYVDYSDAVAAGLTFASIKNKNGEFVAPTLDGATKAVAGGSVPADLSFDPIDATGAGVYPITAPTYILVRKTYGDAAKAALVKGYATFLLTDAQALAAGVNFAKLPDDLVQKALTQINAVLS